MFRIQHLQWLVIVAAAIGSLLLGATAVLSNLDDHRRHSRGAAELQRFSILLDAANAVAAERGPANAAMGAGDAEADLVRDALAAKRVETDEALQRLQVVFGELVSQPRVQAALGDLLRELANGRSKVDMAANAPFATRDPRAVGLGILAMFAAADKAAALRDLVSGHVMAAAPELAGELLLANAASAMRDHEGRLGSYVVMALVAPPERDYLYIQRMQASEGIVLNLWSASVGLAGHLLPDPEITDLVAAVRRDFFEGALPLAKEAAEQHAGDNSLSAAQLTLEYVPGLLSSERLRAAIVTHSIASLERDATQAMSAVIKSTILTGLILAVLVIIAILFRRTLFAPLMRLHKDVLALANGDQSDPEPIRGVAREVDDIFGGLVTLRRHLSDKRALEEEQRRLNRRLRRLAETDTLTGLLNRRALLGRVEAVFRRADRIGESLAVVLFDIDHFKVVNDTHGHAVGDEVLSGVARLVDGALRTGDTLARIGGEEFVIILRRSDDLAAYQMLDRLRQMLAISPVQEKLGLTVTASFGVAVRMPGSNMDWDEIFSLADQRLYIAKDSGRNCVVSEGVSPQTRRRA